MEGNFFVLKWRGTIGMGDAMMALNCAHHHAWHKGCVVNLIMHWDHDENYYHHFEDEETIIDRMQYIHKFYLHKNQVRISHVYNHRGEFYYDEDELASLAKNRYEFEDHYYHNTKGAAPPNLWCFNRGHVDPYKYIKMKLIKQKYISNKIVVWRSLENAEPPRRWKRKLTNDDWDVIIGKLRRRGLHVVELTYRTPIREAMFHLQTCRMALSYDGMWHYVARNLCIPNTVVSDEPISNYHTPRQYTILAHHDKKNERSIWKWVHRIPEFLGEAKRRSIDHQKDLKKFYRYKNLQDFADEFKSYKEGPTLLKRSRERATFKKLGKPMREIK
jgi:hypothetical protein